jgi:Tyrosyl-DNA phosphodiesterase
VPGGNIRLCFPPMPGNVNCMHSKLQLLFHKTYLRIAVPSANLLDFDWGEMGGLMENVSYPIGNRLITTYCEVGIEAG